MKANSMVLLVGLECKPEEEEKFNRWYDEHIPLMLKYPGIRAATRYRITKANEKYPNYLAIYEFENQQALEEYDTSPEHFQARKHVTNSWGEKLPYERKWRVAYKVIGAWEK